MRWNSQLRHGGVAVTLLLGLNVSRPAHAQEGAGAGGGPQETRPVGAPRFEYVGPTNAGRIAAAAAVSGRPGVYYAGAASGGVWKTTDGGATWKPTFDGETSQAIGALAVAPTNPDIVWAGTGEAWAIRDMDMMGDGIYRSTDAGETWTNMGLRETGRIGTIVVHPTNENIVLVCALGRATGPQRERGVYRTENGGRTWQQVLFVNENTGCSGLQISQRDPNIVLAGTWEIELQTHVLHSGGTGSGIFISRNGGRSFRRIEHMGLPRPPYGKTDVAIAPADGNRMYALIQTGSDGVKGMKSQAQGSVWRSDDAGRSWRNVSWDRRLIGRAGYYIRIRVSPDDPDHLLIANSTLWRSRDGGRTWVGGGGGCGDCHDIWWDTNPNMAGHYIVTGDGGMGIFGSPLNPTGNTSVLLPIGQMYRVTIDQRSPYWVYSSRQDDGSMRIASNRPIVPANVPSYARGRQYSQPFQVVRDVTLPSTDAELVASSQMQRDVVRAINDVVDRINRIEIMRAQVEDLRKQHGSDRTLDAALAGIYQKMYDTELHFLSRTEMHSDDKWYVEKYRLYLNLVWLLAEIGGGGGDVAGGVGYRPTNAAVALFQDRLKELDVARGDFDRLMQDVAAFNRKHAGRLAPITDRPSAAATN